MGNALSINWKKIHISSAFCLTQQFGSTSALSRVFQLVARQNCKTVLVEEDYFDEEYTEEYNVFYSKLFHKYPGETKRLHFFASSNINEANLKENQHSYLGFCTIRNLPTRRVLSAVIKPIEDTRKPKESFLICKYNCKVDITLQYDNGKEANHELYVKGFPFIQQDGHVSRCAHAALAVVDSFFAGKGDFNRNSYSMTCIGKLASYCEKAPNNSLSKGLSPLQIELALRKMGYNPLIYQYGNVIAECKKVLPEKIVHYYLESEIPIIIGFPTEKGKHAITIIGHSFDPHDWWQLAEKSYYGIADSHTYYSSSCWIPSFIIQDDNMGPYLNMSKSFLQKKSKDHLLIIVPLPIDVNLTGQNAEQYSFSFLTKLFSAKYMALPSFKKLIDKIKSNKDTKNLYRELEKSLKADRLIIRTYLVDSKKFKGTLSEHLGEIYNDLKMPKYVWVTEISTPELMSKSMRLGEMIIDSTSPPKFHPNLLAVHLPGFTMLRNPEDNKPIWSPLSKDEPTQILSR